MGTKKSVKATTDKKGSRVMNEYSEELVMKAFEWDKLHVNAIQSYFKHQPYAKSEGEKPVIKAKDTEDLIKKVEVIFISYTCAKIAERCKTTLKAYPDIKPQDLYTDIKKLLFDKENDVREKERNSVFIDY